MATLIYYDVLDRPLTSWEVFKFLVNKNNKEVGFNKVLELLKNSAELKQLVGQKNGLYFLKNQNKIIKKRIEKQKIADQKWKKAKQMIKFLQLIPFVRLVAISGSLAMNNTKKDSDIDLLVVAKAGRIWTCRALITLLIHLLGKRRHGRLTKDRFCLNHYLTDNSLEIRYRSLYNAQTYAHLVPVLEIEPGLYKKFQKANQWIKEYLVFYPLEKKGYLNQIKLNYFFGISTKFREFLLNGKIGDGLERFLKRIQEKRIKKDPLTYQARGRVVFNDQQLEFHPDSPEKKILEKYNQKMKKLGFDENWQEKDSGLTPPGGVDNLDNFA